jgi:hypothetical protein
VAIDKEDSPAGPVVRKVKGICAHFHRSTKVILFFTLIVLLSFEFSLEIDYIVLLAGLECSSRDSLGIWEEKHSKATMWSRDTLGRSSTHVGLGQPAQDISGGVYCPPRLCR